MLTQLLLALMMSINPAKLNKDSRIPYRDTLPMPSNPKPLYNSKNLERSPVLRSKYIWEIFDARGPVSDEYGGNPEEGSHEGARVGERSTEYNRRLGD